MKATAKVIVEKVEQPNAAKALFKVLVKEPGYIDRFDESKSRKEKFFSLVYFHNTCPLKVGDKIEATIYVNSNEHIGDRGIEYFPFLVLNEFNRF